MKIFIIIITSLVILLLLLFLVILPMSIHWPFKIGEKDNFTKKGRITAPISICIPCYPRDTHKLIKCLDSIANQTVLPFEVIIGHSEIDESECKRLNKTFHYPFKVIFSPKKTKAYAAENRNRASKTARGEYISFIDADDLMFPQRIEVIWKIINTYHPICIVHGFSKDMNLFKNKIGKIKDKQLMFGIELYDIANRVSTEWILGCIHNGHPTIHKSVIKNIQQDESEHWKRGQDAKFIRDILKFYPRDEKTMIFIDIPLSYYIPAERQ